MECEIRHKIGTQDNSVIGTRRQIFLVRTPYSLKLLPMDFLAKIRGFFEAEGVSGFDVHFESYKVITKSGEFWEIKAVVASQNKRLLSLLTEELKTW